jgi:integrase
MTNAAMQWSVEKQQRLAAWLTGYWAADVWKIADCPLVKAERMLRKYPNAAINFSLLSPGLQRELKYVCWSNFTERKWNADTDGHWFYLPAFIRRLQHTAPEAQSLMEKELGEWESLLHVTGIRQFKPLSNRRYLSKLRVIYACLAETYDEREEFEKDRWDARKLGNRGMPTACNFHLSFDAIVAPWLKQAAKEYCRYATPLFSVGHLQSILFAVKHFSEFARGRLPDFGPADINRPLLLDFYHFITRKNLSPLTLANLYVDLRTFLRVCAREGWGDIPDRHVIFDEDIPKIPKPQPRFIPPEVMDQFVRHLDELPLRVRRMIYILMEVGLRSAELFLLPLDCLLQDSQGAWFLRYYQFKLKKDHTVPITKELAGLIQAQQQEARARWGADVKYLFPNRQGRHYTRNSLCAYLEALAEKHQIRDAAGTVWKFRLHQFRHTVGYRMANSGTRLEIIQQFFGHESIEMSRRYSHIADQTLKAEIERFHAQTHLVDIYGKEYGFTAQADDPALQVLKQLVDQRTLANGYCGIPLVAGPCPHPNKCLTCPHFRTDQTFLSVHERQLAETQNFIKLGGANQWPQMVQENQVIEERLLTIIAAIQARTHDPSTQHEGTSTACASAASSGS